MYSGIGVNGLGGCSCAGPGVTPTPTLPACAQTLEAGWIVSYMNTLSPQFFVFATNNGYSRDSSCWATSGSCGANGPVWVPNPGATITPYMVLPAGVPGGAQHELYVGTLKALSNMGTQDWWVVASIDGAAATFVGPFT